MSGNIEGGRKAAKKNLERDPDFYRKIGKKGGSAFTDKLKGFAANPKLAKEVGHRIGMRTRRGYKWLGDVDKWHGRYRDLKTGMEEIKKYTQAVE